MKLINELANNAKSIIETVHVEDDNAQMGVHLGNFTSTASGAVYEQVMAVMDFTQLQHILYHLRNVDAPSLWANDTDTHDKAMSKPTRSGIRAKSDLGQDLMTLFYHACVAQELQAKVIGPDPRDWKSTYYWQASDERDPETEQEWFEPDFTDENWGNPVWIAHEVADWVNGMSKRECQNQLSAHACDWHRGISNSDRFSPRVYKGEWTQERRPLTVGLEVLPNLVEDGLRLWVAYSFLQEAPFEPESLAAMKADLESRGMAPEAASGRVWGANITWAKSELLLNAAYRVGMDDYDAGGSRQSYRQQSAVDAAIKQQEIDRSASHPDIRGIKDEISS